MSARTSNGTGGGNWSATGTWSGGVVPVAGDTVTIAATDTVTLDGTVSVLSLTINGTLKASRSANTQLTTTGTGSVISFGATGTWDWGTLASPIPSGITATVIITTTTALGAGIGAARNFNSYGAVKTRNTTSSASCASAQKNITVSDVTGWAANDIVVVQGTNSYTQNEIMTVSSIVGNVVTMTANFTYAHASGCAVSNMTSNVTYKPSNTAYPTYVYFKNSYANINYSSFNYFGASTGTEATGNMGMQFDNGSTVSGYHQINHIALYNCNALHVNGFGSVLGGINSSIIVNDLALVSTGPGIQARNYCAGTINGGNVYGNAAAAVGFSSNGGSGAVNFTLSNVGFYGFKSGYYAINIAAGTNVTFSDCIINNNYSGAYITGVGSGILFDSCNIGYGVGTPSNGPGYDFSSANAPRQMGVNFNNCLHTRDAGSNFFDSYINGTNIGTQMFNDQGSPLNQLLVAYNFSCSRDNVNIKNGTSSICMAVGGDPRPGAMTGYTSTIFVPNGVPVTIKGNVKIDGNYVANDYNNPQITVSGLGITPVVLYPDVGITDTWQPFTITVTQNSGAAGFLNINFAAWAYQGNVWLDGIVMAPFVTATRFYGYTFDETNALRTVNPYNSADETTALSYSGISIDYNNKIVTVTQNHTVQELYDYVYAQLSQAANLSQAVFLSTSDGINYNLTYDLVVNGCVLSGSGKSLNLPNNTFTASNAGSTTAIVSDKNGTLVAVSLSNVVSGSQCYIVDSGNNVILNTTASGTTAAVNYTHITDVAVTVRVRLAGYQPFETQGTITSTGLNVWVSQVVDPDYGV